MIILLAGMMNPLQGSGEELSLTVEEKAWIAAHPRIKVHNETNWPPFNYAEKGKPLGLSIDTMNLIAEKTGLQIEYVTGPSWNDFLEMMKAGTLDVMLNIVKTPDRLKYLLYSPPYADNPNTILSRNDTAYENLKQLFGKTVAVPKGFFYEEILKRDYPQINIMLRDNVLETMKAVSFGQADAALGELAVYNHLAHKHLITGTAVSGEVKLGDPELSFLNIATRKNLPVLASILSKGVESITNEEKRSIAIKWLQSQPVEKSELKQASLPLTPDERAWLKEHSVVRIGVDRAYAPFEFVDEDGNYHGVAQQFLELIGQRLGIEFTVVPGLTWAQVVEGAKNRIVDMVPVMQNTEERREFLNFTRPYLSYPTVIFTRNDFPSLNGLADLEGGKLAIPEGYSEIKEIGEKYPAIKTVEVKNLLEGIEAVATGSADATQGNLAVLSYLIQENNITNLKVAASPDTEGGENAMGVRKDWPEFVAILEKAIASITRKERQKILSNWLPEAVVKHDVPQGNRF